jgi:hypothetical protein
VITFKPLNLGDGPVTDPADEPVCPICKSKALLLDTPGEATGYDCPNHSAFKVVGSIFEIPSKLKASREYWEAALRSAKERAKPGDLPVIISDDLP